MPRVAECIVEMVGKLLAGDLRPPSIRVPYLLEITDSLGPPPP